MYKVFEKICGRHHLLYKNRIRRVHFIGFKIFFIVILNLHLKKKMLTFLDFLIYRNYNSIETRENLQIMRFIYTKTTWS